MKLNFKLLPHFVVSLVAILIVGMMVGCSSFKQKPNLDFDKGVQRVVINPSLLEEPEKLPLIESNTITLEQLAEQKQKETKAFYSVRQQALGLIEFVCKTFPDNCKK